MFYTANREIIDVLQHATERGVEVKLILDLNKSAFGNDKTGLPNVPVASALVNNDNTSIRWCDSNKSALTPILKLTFGFKN